MTPNDKAIFVMAYVNGVDSVSTMATKGNPSSRFGHLFSPQGLTGTEIVQALDRFFDAPENAAVPIVDALMRISIRASRLSSAEITAILDSPCAN